LNRFWKRSLFVVAVGLLLTVGVGNWMVSRMVVRLQEALPFSSSTGSVSWKFPFGVTIRDLNIPDPKGIRPFFFKAKTVEMRVPWWGLLIRPLPVKLALDSPHLVVGSDNAAALIGSVSVHPLEWLYIPSTGLLGVSTEEGKEPVPPPIAPLEIRVKNGRVDVIEPELRADAPLFMLDHVEMTMGLANLLKDPTLQLRSYGYFVTQEREIIGVHQISLNAQPLKKYLDGFIRLRHEQLEDFRDLYAHSPSPIYINGGMTDFVTHFKVTEGRHLKFTARCLVQGLDLDAMVGPVSFAEIMHAVEDDRRRYEWTVEVEGNLDEPGWDPHDYLLSEVEYQMKELAASRGVRIPVRMFFYSDMEFPQPWEIPPTVPYRSRPDLGKGPEETAPEWAGPDLMP